MTNNDLQFCEKVITSSLIQSPCLEVGAGLERHSIKGLIKKTNLEYFSTDISPQKGLDYVISFEESRQNVDRCFKKKRFNSIFVLNVLEHVFNPIEVLDNIMYLLNSGGVCVIVTPTIWPLHYHPLDCWRINPNFYEEYCRRRSLELVKEYFAYVSPKEQIYRDHDGNCILPKPSKSRVRFMISRIIHRLFNTCGRGMLFPSHVAVGAVLRKN